MGFDSPGLIHNHEVPSSILGPATKNVLWGVFLYPNPCVYQKKTLPLHPQRF